MRILPACLLTALLTCPVRAQDQQTGPGPLPLAPGEVDVKQERLREIHKRIGFDQRLNEMVPTEVTFRDDLGQQVKLGDYLKPGRPVILVLAYFRCRVLCNKVLDSVVTALRKVRYDSGKDYQVVVVSFDKDETPEDAAQKRELLLANYGRK